MFEEALSLLSMLASMNSWLSSTVLFLLLNLIIFTILFTSHKPPPAANLHHYHHQPPHDLQPQLSRSLSVLQRLKSLNLYNYTPSPHTQSLHHAPSLQPPPTATEIIPEPHLEPAAIEDDMEVDEGPTMEEVYGQIRQQQLAKCVPLLPDVGRISSKTNNSAQYGRQNSHTQPASGEPIFQPYVAPPAAIEDEGPTMEEIYNRIQQQQPPKCAPHLQGVGKILSKTNNSAPQHGRQSSYTEPVGFETHVELPAIEGPTMEEIYSRIIHSKENNNSAPQYGRQNSDTEPAGGQVPVRLPRKMKKSASDKSAFNHFEAVAEVRKTAPPPPAVAEEEEVDARADDFINKFKQQLKMQRMDSVQQYKEMIAKVSAN